MKQLFLLLFFMNCIAMNIQLDEEEGSSLLPSSRINISTFPNPELSPQTKWTLGLTSGAMAISYLLMSAFAIRTMVLCFDQETEDQCKQTVPTNFVGIGTFLTLGTGCAGGFVWKSVQHIKNTWVKDSDFTYYTDRDFDDDQQIEISYQSLKALLDFHSRLGVKKRQQEQEALDLLKGLQAVDPSAESTGFIAKKNLAYLVQIIRKGTYDQRCWVDSDGSVELQVKSLQNINQKIGSSAMKAWLDSYKNDNGDVILKLKSNCNIIQR